MNDYLNIVYDEKLRPYTDYPAKLTQFLFEKFNMQAGQILLEPGCGRGEVLRCFKDLGMSVKGCDISLETAVLLQDLEKPSPLIGWLIINISRKNEARVGRLHDEELVLDCAFHI